MSTINNPFDSDNYPTGEPECIIVGQFVAWRLAAKYITLPVGGTLSYDLSLNTGGATLQSVAGTLSGDYWVFTVPSATSTGWSLAAGGEYRWNLVMTDGGSESAVVKTGVFDIFLSDASRRTHAEIMLAKIESLLENRADADVSNYAIKGRSITKMSHTELLEWRAYYLDEIRKGGGSTTSGKLRKSGRVQIGFD